jgi:integrase
LPGQLAREVGVWISVLRGEGHRPSRVMPWDAIRGYTHYVLPVVHQWSNQTDTLRAITAVDIRAVLSGNGVNVNQLLCALRSMFRALKREQIIFRDPARSIRTGPKAGFPRPLPPDRLRGLLDRAPGAQARIAAALVAIHALRECDLRSLLLADLDRAGGQLTVRRHQGPRQIILDELTLRLASQWLRERSQRWPRSTNPHLLVSQQTATDPAGSPMSRYAIYVIFNALGVAPSHLRIDRILDEARHTADPVHLMRVFGISDGAALRYVYTAHPERRSTLPR